MAVYTTITDATCKGLRAAGMKPEIEKQVEAKIAVQLVSCGSDWTLDRLKTYSDWTIANEASENPVPLPDGFARNRRTGKPIGIFGYLEKLPLQTRLRMVGAMTSAFVEDEITDAQWQKWSKGVLAEKQDIPDPQRNALVDRLAQSFSELVDFESLKRDTERELKSMEIPMLECMTGDSIPCGDTSISIRRNGVHDMRKLSEAYIQQWEYLPNSTLDYIGRLVEDDLLPGHSVLPDYHDFRYETPDELIANEGADTLSSDIVGRIGYLQQPKSKLRAVANPNRIAQAYSVPFGEALQKQVDEDRFSFVKNQDAGHKYIQSLLRTKKGIAYSMDLSAATDTLNFDVLADAFQLAAENAGVDIESHLDYFRDLSNGIWYSAEAERRLGTPYVTFQQGQPLGLRPSFPFLSLANAAMARTAIRESKSPRGIPTAVYACVGDDMLIYQTSSSKAAQIYSQLVSDLGSEANLSKTLTSRTMAEFCGKVITPSRLIAKSPKYKEPTNADALSLVQNFGETAVPLLTDFQRSVLNNIRHIPRKKGGVYGIYKPRTDIRYETAEFAYEAAKEALDKERFIGSIELNPTVQMNTSLMRGLILPREALSNWKALSRVPLVEDLESSLPDAKVFNYRTQSYELPALQMLGGIQKVGKRSLRLLESEPFSEVRSVPQPYTGKPVYWAMAFDEDSKQYLLTAYRKEETGDKILYSQVEDMSFYKSKVTQWNDAYTKVQKQRLLDTKYKKAVIQPITYGFKHPDHGLLYGRPDGKYAKTVEKQTISVASSDASRTLPQRKLSSPSLGDFHASR